MPCCCQQSPNRYAVSCIIRQTVTEAIAIEHDLHVVPEICIRRVATAYQPHAICHVTNLRDAGRPAGQHTPSPRLESTATELQATAASTLRQCTPPVVGSVGSAVAHEQYTMRARGSCSCSAMTVAETLVLCASAPGVKFFACTAVNRRRHIEHYLIASELRGRSCASKISSCLSMRATRLKQLPKVKGGPCGIHRRQ